MTNEKDNKMRKTEKLEMRNDTLEMTNVILENGKI